jgi:WD40 repeat protein
MPLFSPQLKESKVFCLSLLPKHSKYLVASDCGIVYQYSKYQSQSYPKKYQLIQSDFMPSHFVTAINPLFDSYFLTGYDDGNICLFSIEHSAPILKWTLKHPVVQIEVSPKRISVFFVLDSFGTVSIWDLLESTSEPKFQIEIQGCISMHVAGKGPSTTIAYFGFKNGSLMTVDLSSCMNHFLQQDLEEIRNVLGAIIM